MQLANRVATPPQTLTLSAQNPAQPRLTVFHSTGCSNTQSSRPHAHSFFELFFIEEGEGWYSSGDRQVWAKPGDLFSSLLARFTIPAISITQLSGLLVLELMPLTQRILMLTCF